MFLCLLFKMVSRFYSLLHANLFRILWYSKNKLLYNADSLFFLHITNGITLNVSYFFFQFKNIPQNVSQLFRKFYWSYQKNSQKLKRNVLHTLSWQFMNDYDFLSSHVYINVLSRYCHVVTLSKHSKVPSYLSYVVTHFVGKKNVFYKKNSIQLKLNSFFFSQF